MCAHVVTQNPMAELNPVSDTHALLESMLQKLRLNTNSGSISDMQTFSPSGDCIAEPAEDSSKAAVYQFGFSSNSKEQDKRSSVWNNWENPWIQQSPNFESVLTPAAKPVKRITKHSGYSAKPKRPPLIWGPHKRFMSERTDNVTFWVEDDQMPRLKPQFSLEGETSSNVPPSYQRQSFRNPPDLLAPTLTTSSSVLDKTEVKSQWSWASGSEKNAGAVLNEQSGKTTKTSRKKLGEAKRWAQNVKERWRERHRSTQTRQRDDGQTQMQNEVHSNHSSLITPIDVSNTPASLAETANIHQEVMNTALNEDEGPGSLSYLSDSLFPLGTTSNLMEEIFSGTEWAQFLSVNHTTSDQSNEPPTRINQSHEEGWNSKWTHNDTTDCHVVITQPSFLNMASDKPVYNQPDTSQMSVTSPEFTDLTTNPLQTHDPFTNLIKLHNSEQSDRFSYFNPNELKASEDGDPQPMSTQMSDPSQGGTDDFIPLLDLSYLKPKDRSSITSHGSLSRKREHWTKRRDSYEHTTQDMEDKEHSSSFMTTQSSNSVHSVSPTPSLNSVPNSISEDLALETAVKKMKMEETRRVRFAEEVIVFPSGYLPEYNEDDDDEEEEEEEEEEEDEEEEEEAEKDNNDCPEVTSPRTSLPKWIASLKGKSAKYKF